MIELEKTFLAKILPDLTGCKSKEIIDVYYPKESNHPVLRLRKNGDKYEMTKKYPVKEGDASAQHEHTIPLTKEEFDAFFKLEGKKVHKIRYCYEYQGRIAEVDIFQGDLKGLVLVDFEFEKEEDKNNFQMPDFCLANVTQEKFTAGGMLCGKSYMNIINDLARFGYKKLDF
ncbi:hypothetical protein COV18_04575 [Candidatus Woesearchaeota archaeon CG10_big_fil_rev_8_21_14_0_10_37_12]|nr:MAG: hypothetical protein COV18_04575 [Candidatus Woesearchaeota archaeon CG10_big_fil_rev_8_21_14_0_10_37_12]